MKVLSLLQPWANALFTKDHLGDFAVKSWETRSWKPTDFNLNIIQTEGMLIHASARWGSLQKELMGKSPYSDYLSQLYPMEKSAIIGWVKVGRILTTEQWLEMNNNCLHGRNLVEYQFGDYSPNRYAWEITRFEKFETPIPAKGKLSLWDYNGPLPEFKVIDKPKEV